MMRVLAATLFVLLSAGVLPVAADVPPPYEPYGIGARLSDSQPFPVLLDVRKNGGADKSGLKSGDAVIAIDGSYSNSGRVPFYFYARGMQGRKGTLVELVILRGGTQVFTVKAVRDTAVRGGW